jgi:hypothetical protein
MKTKYKKCFKVIVLIYVLLWVLTATWGLADVDRVFDRQFEWAYSDPSLNSIGIDGWPKKFQRIEIMRADGVNLHDPYGVENRANAKNTPKQFWRCRTKGFPIAPFLILDEAGAQWGELMGLGGRRLTIWFFGWNHCWWIQHYWAS